MAKFFMMMSCLVLVLTGCQSHKLPMPKGKWIPVNQVGFIPPNVTKYSDDVKNLSQDIDNIDKLVDEVEANVEHF